MKEGSPSKIYLKNYATPAFWVSTVDLYFNLQDGATEVSAVIAFQRNADADSKELHLEGVNLELLSLSIDDRILNASEYHVDGEGLTILETPDEFVLRSVVKINPEANTALEGLYQSSGNYCTQCEAHGFRKITYYPDRPDVMAVFTTTVEADKTRFPVLLSNGNPIDDGEADNNRHWVKWHDPHKKPCYLFALVAGDLALTEGSYTTQSGRNVSLQIFTEHHNADKTAHAVTSLQKSMRWDEETFGLEYDLDIYMIVAVDDFNMGAMENKGLNVFNSKFVLALPETATDTDYVNIEAVIAHEYFHNWTGNRVTCRDWFQLSLKEGLTVFRDQSFTADMTSAAIKRIDDVRMLRSVQFAEDAGPMAHPVRPDAYIEINNFYTVTVYEKGAEVVRMYQTLLGRDGFRKGMDLYFQRHDGQAVTTDDFRSAMADANDIDLSLFQRWYEQAGTPRVNVTAEWDEAAREYKLNFIQLCPANQDSSAYTAMMIPIKTGLLDAEGKTVAEQTLTMTELNQTLTFSDLDAKPVPSLLRGFSAPVVLEYDYSDEELAFLAANDSDDFNRWEAGQRLALKVLLKEIENHQNGDAFKHDQTLLNVWQAMFKDEQLDPALLAEAIVLPTESYLAEKMQTVDPDAIHQTRENMRQFLAGELSETLESIYQTNQTPGEYSLDATSMGKRRLKNISLAYLTSAGSEKWLNTALEQFSAATNMTDSMGALSALSAVDCEQRKTALDQFQLRWKDNSLVMDKWFALQASAPLPSVLDEVKALMKDPLFSIKNPNKVRALIGAFSANSIGFHAKDGSGYKFMAEKIMELDEINPQITSRLAKQFARWRRYDENRQSLMKQQLNKIQDKKGLSKDVFEVVSRSLGE